MKTQLGHYDIVAELGRGGMGVVYKGYERSLNRYVAIKVLAESLAHDESVKERFLREARSMAALNDPHIIQIYFIGEQDGQTFFVMEFVEGESLGSLLKHEDKLTPEQAARTIYQTAQGLATAHDKGVIHRDIKPANLMINSRGQVKIADFGIALVTQDFSKKLTTTGEFVGTPGYLSPEVCLGKPVDQRSDLFSLGIVLFEMLTGRMPFTDESPLGLMLEVVKAEIPDVRQLNDAVDPELSRILAKMIAKEPADRYQSCQELVADLARHPGLAGGQTLTVRPSVSPAAATLIGAKTPVSGQSGLPITQPTQRPASLQADVSTLPPPATKTGPSVRPSVLDRPTTPGNAATKKSAAMPLAIAAALLLALGGGAWAFRDQLPFVQKLMGGSVPVATTAAPATTPVNPPATIASLQSTPETSSTAVAAPPPSLVPAPATTLSTTPDNTVVAATTPAETTAVPSATTEPAAPFASSSNIAVADATGAPEPRASQVDALKDLPAARAAEAAPGPRIAKATEPDRPTVPSKPRLPTVAVIAGGDDVISEPVQQEITKVLQRAGYNVVEDNAADRAASLLGGRPDFAGALTAVARGGRVDAVVFVNAKPVGTQELNYYGQSSTLYTVQLGVRAYRVGDKHMLGSGWSQEVHFTTLNASEKAREAIEPMIGDVEANLTEFRARRGRG